MLSYKHFFFFLLLCSFFLSQKIIAQNETIYTEFHTFFEKEIKFQGVKGNWIFGLNEITAYHKFDYNNDGFNDLLIEFNATPVDEGNYTNYYAVLFKNENNKSYHFIDYVEVVDLQFINAEGELFVFQGVKNVSKVVFKLENSKFEAFKP
ncbi:hypothetical protein ACFQ5N_06230 [Lutibacter holmesii]|uniref:VCBS repeat-containing protein n=1 Tax=Lutibacter holmesii TaxID=1137985 RepID=A0ABW3WNU7_9FLAO